MQQDCQCVFSSPAGGHSKVSCVFHLFASPCMPVDTVSSGNSFILYRLIVILTDTDSELMSNSTTVNNIH